MISLADKGIRSGPVPRRQTGVRAYDWPDPRGLSEGA